MELTNKDTITSLELLEQINFFRKQEGGRAELQHKTLLEIIRDEFEEEIGEQNILPTSTYKDSQGKDRPMFILTISKAKQVLVRESKYVRKAVIHKLEELENKTKLPGTYKEALLALVAAEEEKEQLLLANKQQQELIAHKVEVITGLTDEVDVFKKKDIINRIIKNSGNLYRERYNEIYFAFKNTYHVDLPVRAKSYNTKQTKKKDQLSVIGYAEKFGHIDQMYKICCKLYETEVNLLLKELGLLVNL